MLISIIAAMSENRVIGRDGLLPWHIPADLANFRAITMGHPLLMGRRTYESIGHPLPGRSCIVLTRQSDYHPPGCIVVADFAAAVAAAGAAAELFVCGGGELYRQVMPLADRLYLTIVHRQLAGDAHFPPVPEDFRLLRQEELAAEPGATFYLMERQGQKR